MGANFNKNFKDLILGMVLGITITFALPQTISLLGHRLEWIPYDEVVVRDFSLDENYIYLTVTFNKIECEYQYLDVFAETLSTWERLEWIDVDGPQGNRHQGEHTLSLRLELPEGRQRISDRIQVMTRHRCGASRDIVDRILFSDHLANAREL